ncbi:MAG: PepSY domain-containing protein [Marinicaulis sp.]|nr:PepSY domain-containing protein [Marinicaulis sp.]NNL90267.1 PepSY domain-containing protein [Marinicaulis sp.]
MAVQKWTVRIHKWVALIVGLQIVLWIAGGFVMSAIPIEVVRGEHKISHHHVEPFDVAKLRPLSDVANVIESSAVKSAALGEMLGRPVWRIVGQGGDLAIVDARSGAVLSPITEATARAIAERDYKGEGAFQSIAYIESPPNEYNKAGPVWRVQFDDPDATTIYVDPSTGEVTARRSQTWRLFDFFWKLHVMDYDDGADFNHPLLITAAGAAIFVSLSGFFLLIIKMRRSFLTWRRQRKNVAEANI